MAFTKLCKMLREEFEKHAEKTGKERFLLTAAVAGAKNTIDKAYEVDKIAEYLDWFNLMTYDLHGMYRKKKSTLLQKTH
jgi:GH18 family chitinase